MAIIYVAVWIIFFTHQRYICIKAIFRRVSKIDAELKWVTRIFTFMLIHVSPSLWWMDWPTYPASDFLYFLPGSYKVSSGFLDISARNTTRILKDHGRLSRKKTGFLSKNAGIQNCTKKCKDRFFTNFSKFSRYCTINSRIFPDFSGFSRIIEETSGLHLKFLKSQRS